MQSFKNAFINAAPFCKRILVILLFMSLNGCWTGARLQGPLEKTSIAQQLSLAPTAKPRIFVAGILDKTNANQALTTQLPAGSQPAAMLGGIRDMLTTGLFESERFIVLEREMLSDVILEQSLAESANFNPKTQLPAKQLEGAEWMLVGAITEFDAEQKGGDGFPIPIPLGSFKNWGIMKLNYRRSQITLTLRLIEIATGRVLFSNAVQGHSNRWGINLAGILSTGRRRAGYVRLPAVLGYFSNTPVEKALQSMVEVTVDSLVQELPQTK